MASANSNTLGPVTVATGSFLPVNGSTSPYIQVQFDYQNAPSSLTTTWTDITPYVVSYSRQPVRTNQFDQPGPTGATIVLRNDDARFIPDNTSGPYYGGLLPYRRFRVRAQWAGVTYDRYFGYAVDWPQSWDDAGRNQTVTVQLVDNLAPLETADLQGSSFNSKLSGAAIQDVLTVAGAGPGGIVNYTFPMALDTGASTIAASGVLGTGSYALQRLKDIAASENGVVYADGAGVINFHDRHRRLTGGTSVNVQATIGDGAANEIPYTDPQPSYGDSWSTVQVTPFGGTVQTASLVSAGPQCFSRIMNFPTGGTYLVSDPSEALDAAEYLINRLGTPVTNVSGVTLIGAANTNLWPTILSLDTSDKVIFNRRFLNKGVVGGTMSLTQFVEGYGESVQIGSDWRVSVSLSPADIQGYWVLGDSTYGVLGQTTRVVY